jgi:hypothetical protein
MKTMNHHDARGPEETVHYLPPVVPAEPASGSQATGLRQAGVPNSPPSRNASELAPPESRLRYRLAD